MSLWGGYPLVILSSISFFFLNICVACKSAHFVIAFSLEVGNSRTTSESEPRPTLYSVEVHVPGGLHRIPVASLRLDLVPRIFHITCVFTIISENGISHGRLILNDFRIALLSLPCVSLSIGIIVV